MVLRYKHLENDQSVSIAYNLCVSEMSLLVIFQPDLFLSIRGITLLLLHSTFTALILRSDMLPFGVFALQLMGTPGQQRTSKIAPLLLNVLQ